MEKRYRWTHPKPLRRQNVAFQGNILLSAPNAEANFIRQGDVFTPTPEELAAFPDRIEEIEESKK